MPTVAPRASAFLPVLGPPRRNAGGNLRHHVEFGSVHEVVGAAGATGRLLGVSIGVMQGGCFVQNAGV